VSHVGEIAVTVNIGLIYLNVLFLHLRVTRLEARENRQRSAGDTALRSKEEPILYM
jgi:hypothetical protein